MEKMESILKEFFESRVESVVCLTDEEKEIIGKDKVEINIKEFFPNATDDDIYKIEQIIDLSRDNMACEMGYFEEKYYKTGFADAIKLVLECMKN